MHIDNCQQIINKPERMKKILLTAAIAMAGVASYGEESPLWMRYCAISPDGERIAFTYKGDIYTVPAGQSFR